MRWWSFLHKSWCCSITWKLAMINFIKVDLVCRQRWQKVGQPLHLVCLWKLTMLTEMQTSRFAQSADYQSKQAVIWYFLGTSLDWGRLRCKPGIMWLIVGGGWLTRRWFALGILFGGILARVGWGLTNDLSICAVSWKWWEEFRTGRSLLFYNPLMLCAWREKTADSGFDIWHTLEVVLFLFHCTTR